MANTITIGEVTDLENPKIRKIAMRVVKQMELAMEKVVANDAEPAAFPMPQQADSVEQIIRSRYQQLKPEQKQLARAKLLPRAKGSAALRKQVFGDLAGVDIRSAAPVSAQARKLPFPQELKLSAAEVKQITGGNGTTSRAAAAAALPITDKLELRIHRLKCVDETGGGLFGETGKDEMALAATIVDETGDTEKVAEREIGAFNDGDVKTFAPPLRFATFNLREGTEFPKSYFATLVLAEKDLGGGLSNFINQLLDKVKQEVISALAAAIGGAIGASGGPIGALIGAAVGFVVGKVFELLKSLFADDIFTPKTVTVAISSLTHRFSNGATDSAEAVTRFVGHDGTYDLTYDWRVFA